MEKLQEKHLLKFKIVGQGDVIKYRLSGWAKYNRMGAIGTVVEYFHAEDSREIMVNGNKAVIYVFPDREYLCWTISAEDSCVIECVPSI